MSILNHMPDKKGIIPIGYNQSYYVHTGDYIHTGEFIDFQEGVGYTEATQNIEFPNSLVIPMNNKKVAVLKYTTNGTSEYYRNLCVYDMNTTYNTFVPLSDNYIGLSAGNFYFGGIMLDNYTLCIAVRNKSTTDLHFHFYVFNQNYEIIRSYSQHIETFSLSEEQSGKRLFQKINNTSCFLIGKGRNNNSAYIKFYNITYNNETEQYSLTYTNGESIGGEDTSNQFYTSIVNNNVYIAYYHYYSSDNLIYLQCFYNINNGTYTKTNSIRFKDTSITLHLQGFFMLDIAHPVLLYYENNSGTRTYYYEVWQIPTDGSGSGNIGTRIRTDTVNIIAGNTTALKMYEDNDNYYYLIYSQTESYLGTISKIDYSAIWTKIQYLWAENDIVQYYDIQTGIVINLTNTENTQKYAMFFNLPYTWDNSSSLYYFNYNKTEKSFIDISMSRYIETQIIPTTSTSFKGIAKTGGKGGTEGGHQDSVTICTPGILSTFDSSSIVIPNTISDWTAITENTEYTATNDYGTWKLTASGVYSTYIPPRIIDGNDSSMWESQSLGTNDDGFIQIDFPVLINPNTIYVVGTYISNTQLQLLNLNNEWIDCGAPSGTTAKATTTFNLTFNEFFKGVRIYGKRYSSNYTRLRLYTLSLLSGQIYNIQY